jgi:hypothetical protein
MAGHLTTCGPVAPPSTPTGRVSVCPAELRPRGWGSARTLAGCLSIFGQSAFAAALIQCYATRTGDGCVPLSVHATMAECRKLASEYQKFDTRDLRVKGVPAVVSYHCVAVRVTVSARGGKRSFR